jgi:TrmH family RNA methyltransferase
VESICSKKNSGYVQALKLKQKRGRDKEGALLVEGDNVVRELLEQTDLVQRIYIRDDEHAAHLLQELLPRADEANVTTCILQRVLFDELASTVTPQGVIGIIRKPDAIHLEDIFHRQRETEVAVVVLDRLQDPGNVGTIIRTAIAAGFDAIVSMKGTVDIFSDKVIRSSTGLALKIPMIYSDSPNEFIQEAQAHKIKTIVCDMNAPHEYYDTDLTGSVAVVVGNEGNGTHPDFLSQAHSLIRISMVNSVESLNAAVTAGIVMYERVRQNKTK